MNIAKTLGIIALTLACANTADAAESKLTAIQKGAKLVVRATEVAIPVYVEGTGAFGEVAVLAGVVPTGIGTFVGVRDIDIETGDGDDFVHVSGIEIGGSIKVRTGGGIDQFTLDNTLAVAGDVRRVYIGGSIDANLGGQPAVGGSGLDRIDWATTAQGHWITIAKNVTIRGAGRVDLDGAGIISDSDIGDLRIGGTLSIECKTESFLFLFDVNVGGKTDLDLGNAADQIELRRCHFTRAFTASLGGGNDVIDFKLGSEFNAPTHIDGGSGIDTVPPFAESIFATPVVFKKFEVLP